MHFDISKTEANDTFHYWLKILREVLPASLLEQVENIEHIIRLLKIFRIASERFRLHSQVYERIILTVCGLVRLRIGTLVLTVNESG
ncbi:MAG: hypothetical protein ACR9NN_08065 [Nostochopsis sp.]